MDLGTLYDLHPFTLAAAIQNMGPQMKFLEEGYNLPLTLAAGASYKPFQSILLSADLKQQPYDNKTVFGVGGEFMPVSILALRAGYISQAVRPDNGGKQQFSESLSNISGLGMGLGLKVGPGSLDYAFTPSGELGNAQRVSLTLKF